MITLLAECWNWIFFMHQLISRISRYNMRSRCKKRLETIFWTPIVLLSKISWCFQVFMTYLMLWVFVTRCPLYMNFCVIIVQSIQLNNKSITTLHRKILWFLFDLKNHCFFLSKFHEFFWAIVLWSLTTVCDSLLDQQPTTSTEFNFIPKLKLILAG